ncbi:magnesium and cobalt transport protein CorA [Streptomyces sioyaensis]|uniref:magnesium and cobalt transport protein CorA n=1 Tax=Streptomyces sioyaensis TaxID=67364 RepID=UPI0037979D92
MATSCTVYTHGARPAVTASIGEARAHVRAGGQGFAWIALHAPSAAELAPVADLFGLCPSAVEDALGHQRPQLAQHGDALYTVFRTVRPAPAPPHRPEARHATLITDALLVVTGAEFVLTVQHSPSDALDRARRELEATPLRSADGPSAVLHAIADQLTDDYAAATDALRGAVERLEAAVFAEGCGPRVEPSRIYSLKHELLALKRAVTPLEHPLRGLAAPSCPIVSPHLRDYFSDVADRLADLAEQVASYDELLNSILEADLAQLTLAQNGDMRRISARMAICAVPTMVCGVYGMNFVHMPERHATYGYPVVLTFVAAACLLMRRAFRRSGWL